MCIARSRDSGKARRLHSPLQHCPKLQQQQYQMQQQLLRCGRDGTPATGADLGIRPPSIGLPMLIFRLVSSPPTPPPTPPPSTKGNARKIRRKTQMYAKKSTQKNGERKINKIAANGNCIDNDCDCSDPFPLPLPLHLPRACEFATEEEEESLPPLTPIESSTWSVFY